MSSSGEEIYSTMFSSLKHPVRRKILRMLADKPMTFSEMSEVLGISSSHLTYHLESLGELLTKTDNSAYKLSTFGEASVNTMKVVEEAPATYSKQGRSLSIRWKSILAFLVVATIILSSVSSAQYVYLNQISKDNQVLQSEYERLLSWSAGTHDAIAFLQEVVQIDTSKFQATQLTNDVTIRADLGNIPEELLKYSLSNSESEIDVVLRFRNDSLFRYQINLLEGSLVYTQPQPANVLDSAKNIVERYIAYAGASYLEDMSDMLASVNETQNTEIVSGNTKLEILTSGDTTRIQWMYTENGVDFQAKGLSLLFENRVLMDLMDGWLLFTVGSTEVNVSSEQAVTIAKNNVKDFTWTVGDAEVTGFVVLDKPVSVQLVPHPMEKTLTLKPYWFVILELDKVYPGGVNRIGIGLWADTGEVNYIRTYSN